MVLYYVYILFSKKLNRFYVGTTDNVDERLKEHNDAAYEKAFTIKGIPWQLFLIIDCSSSKQAYSIEEHIKKMKSKVYITNLKKHPDIIEKLIARY